MENFWQQLFPAEGLGSLGRHIYFGMDQDYIDILGNDIPELRKRALGHLKECLKTAPAAPPAGFEELLHPLITEHALRHYKDGDLREAVLNAVMAVFDLIRLRTDSKGDGERLINEVFSLEKPLLVLSELESETGKSDQKGFMQIFRGVFQGVRNPKSHTLIHDLTPHKAAQYLVFASLLARRIDEAIAPVKKE